MPTLRQTYSKFQDMTRQLDAVRTALKAEIEASRRAVQIAYKDLESGIAAVITTLDDDTIQRLDLIASKAGVQRSFSRIVEGMNNADQETETKIATLQAQWRSPDKLIKEAEKKAESLESVKSTARQTDVNISVLTNRRADIDEHNAKCKSKLTPETAGKFRPFKFWQFIFNSEYRSGYTALRNYEAKGAKFAADDALLTTLNATLSDIRRDISARQADIGGLHESIRGLNAIKDEIGTLESNLQGHEGILKAVRATVFQLALNHPAFAAGLATDAGETLGRPIVAAPLNIQALRKSEALLEAQMKGVVTTKDKLEKPMSKLRRGASQAGSKSIRIDLDGIEKAVNDLERSSKKRSSDAAAFRSGVADFRPNYNDDTGFMMLQSVLLWNALTPHVDTSYCNHVLGNLQDVTPNIPDTSCTVPDTSMPSFDAGLSGDFNTSALDNCTIPDTSNLQVPDFQMPNFDVPSIDVSVPAIDIPTISVDVPTFDVSSSISIDTSSFSM